VIDAWRLVQPWHADDAFSGEGALLYGGRWNVIGTRAVYAASSVSLATLELIVHVARPSRLDEYALIACAFPDAIVDDLDPAQLPPDWRTYPPPPAVQKLGDAWVKSGASAVLRVPSVVIASEFNYILNPEHADFGSVAIGLPKPFKLDWRLLT
jgi:RES domain-containing protein